MVRLCKASAYYAMNPAIAAMNLPALDWHPPPAICSARFPSSCARAPTIAWRRQAHHHSRLRNDWTRGTDDSAFEGSVGWRFAMRVSSFLAAVAVLFGVASVADAQGASSASAACSLPHASGVQQRQLMSGGRERSYRLFVPPRYDGRTPLPIVLDL